MIQPDVGLILNQGGLIGVKGLLALVKVHQGVSGGGQVVPLAVSQQGVVLGASGLHDNSALEGVDIGAAAQQTEVKLAVAHHFQNGGEVIGLDLHVDADGTQVLLDDQSGLLAHLVALGHQQTVSTAEIKAGCLQLALGSLGVIGVGQPR